MATTTNFGWTTPDDTDLVKDGAAAIRTLGSSIDTSLVDLKGGTTGQILSKASNTDLDYTWIANDQGDITEVQAGVGISIASGTGPIPVITNTATDLITTAGDLLYGSAADTLARLGIGTAGQILAVNSGATAPEWTTAPSGGAVKAVAQAFKSNTFTTSSVSLTDITSLSITYTPTSASNKILLIAHIFGMGTIGTSGIGFAFARGGTAIGIGDASGALSRVTAATQGVDVNNGVTTAMMYLDSPATTSSTSWSVQCKVDAGTAYINRTSSDGYFRGTSSFTLMEVLP
jgi:hypothetical protein